MQNPHAGWGRARRECLVRVHTGQDRTNLRRPTRADDSNGVTGLQFHSESSSLSRGILIVLINFAGH